MEFKEQQDVVLKQACDRCGRASEQCACENLTVQKPETTLLNTQETPQQKPEITGPLADYTLGERLSHTVRSSIYLAKHAGTGQVFALKVMKTKPITDRTAQRKLQQEGKAVTALTHPHIASVYDSGLSKDNLPFVARDSVDGISLSQLIDREGSLSRERFLDIFQQVADALAYAHENGVLHLSLKPENIILTKQSDGTVDFIKVVDFGVSRMIPAEEQGTADGRYLSPEQCSGGAVSSASDVYAFGCVMYEALCGHAPFHDGDNVEIMQKQIRKAPQAVSKVARHPIEPELDSLVMRCMGKDPNSRPQSGKELAYELQQIYDGTATIPTAVQAPSKLRTIDMPKPSSAPISMNKKIVLIGILVFVLANLAITLWPIVTKQTPVAVEELPAEWKLSLEEAAKYERQGNLQMTESYLQRALNEAESANAKDGDLAIVLSKLGSYYYSHDRPLDAAPLLIRALPLYAVMEGSMGADVDWIATDLTEIAQKTNNWDMAIEMYHKLQPMREKQDGKESAKYATLLAGLGGAYIHTHDYPAAEKALRESLAIQKRLPQTSDSGIAASKTMLNIAYVLDRQGQTKEAEPFYRDAVSAAQRAKPENKEVSAKALDYYANFLKRTGDKARGEKMLQQSREMRGLPARESVPAGTVSGAHSTRRERVLDKAERALQGAEKAVDGAGKMIDKAKGWRDKLRGR